MTKEEQRKMARLEFENEELRDTINNMDLKVFALIRESCSYRVAINDILTTIQEAKEFAK